jgi:hypothetical protein
MGIGISSRLKVEDLRSKHRHHQKEKPYENVDDSLHTVRYFHPGLRQPNGVANLDWRGRIVLGKECVVATR